MISDADGKLRTDPDVIAQRLGEALILLHLRTNRFFELNRTAARFWELLSDGYGRDQIEKQMFEEFEVDPLQLAAEIEGILVSMKKESLVLAG